MQDEVALEPDQQVLATRSDRLDGSARQPLRPAVGGVAALWRDDLVGHAALEHGADPRGGVVDRVALGHLCNRLRVHPRAGHGDAQITYAVAGNWNGCPSKRGPSSTFQPVGTPLVTTGCDSDSGPPSATPPPPTARSPARQSA